MTITELAKKYKNYSLIPISISVHLAKFNPFQLVRYYDPADQRSMIFNYDDNRYTTVIINPLQIITARDNLITITDQHNHQQKIQQSPISFLNHLYHQNRAPQVPTLPPFTGGLIGCFSYEFAKYNHDLHLSNVPDPLHLNDFNLFLPNVIITYDHKEHQLFLIKMLKNAAIKEHENQELQSLRDYLDEIEKVLKHAPYKIPSLLLKKKFTNQFSFAEFKAKVKQVKRWIIAGDVFQLIFSDPYYTDSRGSLMIIAKDLYDQKEASPYHFYLAQGDFHAVGASPETLIRKSGQHLYSYPLAGTRRRGRTPQEDQKFAHELQTNPKELSEHNMLVDLGRNDLGRISKFGTVKVKELRNLLKFSEVMHLGSKIESIANEKLTPADIVSATLPAGTLSGAPKSSAMQIIIQLEQRKRGIYGGGIGFLDFDGDLNLCIGIRLAYQKKHELVVHAGAGIVKDSQPKLEYHECMHKDRLMMKEIKTLAKMGRD